MDLSKNKPDFHQLLKRTVEKYRMLETEDSVVVAVSGGPDSVALLSGLLGLADEYRLKLRIFHLNHQLRPNAERDAEFVRQLGLRHQVPVTIESVDVGGFCRRHNYSIQEGARIVRYKLLDKITQETGARKIATGHHANDVVETFLMRLLKGAPLSGLTGIPPIRNGKIIRPLIEQKRGDIEAYLHTNGIEYIIDETNLTDKYRRNRVRHHLMPALEAQEPDYLENILHTCEILREEEAYLAGAASKIYKKMAFHYGNEVAFNAENLKKIAPALGYRLLGLAVRELNTGRREITSRRLKDLWKALNRHFKRCDLSDKIGVCLDRGQVVIFSRDLEPLKQTELVIDEIVKVAPDIKLALRLGGPSDFSRESDCFTAFADAEKISWPLNVKSFQPGDRFIPLGMKGKKKLHDFFIDEKVPRRVRRRVPIVADRQRIIWVGGYRLDERVKVTETTTKIAIIKMIVGNSH